jgi:tetratricopeptide (TPR) repeat protein
MNRDENAEFRKRISKSQIIGSRGEMFIAFLMSQFCLVRPVANGTDVGVDLYCEALLDGVPHSHFWVQVKTTKNKLSKKMRFEVKHLEYWARQPIPVYIFFVSENKMALDKFRINIINLSEKFISEPYIDPKVKTKSLSADLMISSVKELEHFVLNDVPETIARLFLRDGVIFPIRNTVYEQYEKRYKTVGVHKFTKVIMKNIGRTSTLLLEDMLNQSSDEFNDQKIQLEKILETYEGWGNYDFHYILGLAKQRKGQYDAAIKCYERSLEVVLKDKKAEHHLVLHAKRIISIRLGECRINLQKRVSKDL